MKHVDSSGTATDRDSWLMKRLRDGDSRALDELLNTHWKPLTAYAHALVDCPDAAEDIVQDAFIRVWQHRRSWKPRGSVQGYLYRIVRNRALDEQKRQRVRTKWRVRQAGGGDCAEAADLAERRDLARAMKRAIEALPPRRREVFTLARLHELTYAQVAEIMGISPQTVANQMAAALSELRRLLEPYYDRSRSIQQHRSAV